MIIGLSGTQGTGKSTVLAAAKTAGFSVVETSISRNVQAKLGWDNLSRAQESIKNMMVFQIEVASVMLSRDIQEASKDNIVLVERTPADVWAYTNIWCARNNICVQTDPWASDYYEALKLMAKVYTAFVIIPQVKEIPFVKDPHRADLDSRDEVDLLIRKFIAEQPQQKHEIFTISREDRSIEIVNILKQYEN
jgi:predicted ATPase